MSEQLNVEQLIVLVGSSLADGETWVVDDAAFVDFLFERAPEHGRIMNPSNYSIDGYVSFTNTVLDGSLPVRLEELQVAINERFACWDAESECFDTTICSGVSDVYAFVNANALNASSFGPHVFSREAPQNYNEWLTGASHSAQPSVEKVKSSTTKKPWLL